MSSEPCSSSAKAVENTKVIIIDQHDLQMMITTHPASALDMMVAVSKRRA